MKKPWIAKDNKDGMITIKDNQGHLIAKVNKDDVDWEQHVYWICNLPAIIDGFESVAASEGQEEYPMAVRSLLECLVLIKVPE